MLAHLHNTCSFVTQQLHGAQRCRRQVRLQTELLVLQQLLHKTTNWRLTDVLTHQTLQKLTLIQDVATLCTGRPRT